MQQNAAQKRTQKNCDWIVANGVDAQNALSGRMIIPSQSLMKPAPRLGQVSQKRRLLRVSCSRR
ncbi:hypothetical protein [Sorlinia euscelidii]|uniref:hypothetical protein n=1 Tax=Sorlinia euscelidii TaxID=3081148 RepID=UPI00374E1FC7